MKKIVVQTRNHYDEVEITERPLREGLVDRLVAELKDEVSFLREHGKTLFDVRELIDNAREKRTHASRLTQLEADLLETRTDAMIGEFDWLSKEEK